MGIYKNTEAKKNLMQLYEKKLASLQVEYDDLYIKTNAGETHILRAGDLKKPSVAVLHGIDAGTPLTLEAMTDLLPYYNLYLIDSIGQTTKSAENRLPLKDNSYGYWLKEVFEQMELNKIPVIAVSYGAFLLQRLLAIAPEKVERAIFIVPGGLVNGKFWPSIKMLSWPLMKFMFSKSDEDLTRFLSAFYHTIGPDDLSFHRNNLLGVKMDYRRPPLVKRKEMDNFKGKVFIMVADDDIFFPGQEAIARCQQVFNNFVEAYILKNTKHFPHQKTYPLINEKIREWLER
jgi:pimeloyl-ACP methyl ester carboxylesterase